MIKERSAGEWQHARHGTPAAVDKPMVQRTRVGHEVEYPRPPDGIGDDVIDVEITSRRAQFLIYRFFDNT
eukprot:1700714-Lingulodinium_polyedra.AAC.1